MTLVPVELQVRALGILTPLQVHTLSLNSSGGYLLVAPLEGVYDLLAKGSHWLRHTLSSVVVNGTGVANFSLTNGDVDGDNEVTLFDFGALVAAFGSMPGDANWNADADLDGDEEVTLFDFGILDRNVGMIGTTDHPLLEGERERGRLTRRFALQNTPPCRNQSLTSEPIPNQHCSQEDKRCTGSPHCAEIC